MNKNIGRLVNIAQKDSRTIIGLMSGTSLDGLDVAVCEIKGSGFDTQLSLKNFTTQQYDEDFKNEIREIFSKQNVDLQKLCLLNEWIGSRHAVIVNDCLQNWGIKNKSIDLIASHGQTIYHAPKNLHQYEKFSNATLQIGDGDHIAVTTGIITISDFRQKNIAAGAEGAPLAVYGDHLLFSKTGEDRILLNIGGIANFTWLPGSKNITEIFSTDIGPGNTMMDAFIQQHFPGKYFDEGAYIAKQGMVNENLLKTLKENSFFSRSFPKTTGPELFNLNYLQAARERSNTNSITIEDTMSTLNRFSADMIIDSIKKTVKDQTGIKVFYSGGGAHNPLVMQQLKEQLPQCSFDTTGSLGIDPDAKEAVLFAVLANECICGDPATFGAGTNGIPAISMGKISFPS
jgi:anhydro-N-acetylmuramic acid kinase